MKFFWILLFWAICTNAALTEENVTLKLLQEHLIIKTKDGFHINQEAPAKVFFDNADKPLRPFTINARQLDFNLGRDKTAPFQLHFYVCDDQLTSCVPYKGTYRVHGEELIKVDLLDNAGPDLKNKQVKDESKNESKDKKIQYNAHQFILNDLTAALKLASSNDSILFVDFAAPWCPACVRLETEVFNTSEFQKLTSKLIKVSLNADLVANRSFFNKYEVNLLPTLILMNSKGEELYRMVDYKPPTLFIQELTQALKSENLTTDQLIKKANQKDKQAIMILGDRAMNMNHFEEALKWYELLGIDSIKRHVSMISVLNEKYEKNKDIENDYVIELKKAIALYPSSYEALDWRLNLADIDKKMASKILNENVIFLNNVIHNKKLANKIFANTTAGTISFPLIEAQMYLFKTYEKLENPALIKKALNAFQKEIKKVATTPKRPGALMQIVQYQREAQMPEEEHSLRLLVGHYPSSHVYHMKLGNFYFRNKRFQEALPELTLSTQLEKPLSLPNLSLLAKLQKELKLNEELKKSVELADNLPEAKLEKYQEKIKQLHELLLPEK